MTNHKNLLAVIIVCFNGKRGKDWSENVISNITQIDKKYLAEKLALELPALRAKIGNSQAEMGELIGVSRQTYSMIETQKKEMGWSVYMALILVFSSNPKTASLLEFCGAYPNQLRNILQQDDSQKIANTFAKDKKDRYRRKEYALF